MSATDPQDTVVASPPLGRRWIVPGGEEDENGITLHVVVSDFDGWATKRYAVTIPLSVDESDLIVGEPEVTERKR